MINILFVDDHPLMRFGLRNALANETDIGIIDEATNGLEAINKIDTNQYSLVILDLLLPGISGFDVLKHLRMFHHSLNILIFTALPEEHYAIRCLKAGATGFIMKDCPLSELITAIKRVAAGLNYVNAAITRRLIGTLNTDWRRPLHENLSDREFQVFTRLGIGKTISEIAQDLHLSVPTVHTYRTRILKKMGMTSTAELMVYVVGQTPMLERSRSAVSKEKIRSDREG